MAENECNVSGAALPPLELRKECDFCREYHMPERDFNAPGLRRALAIIAALQREYPWTWEDKLTQRIKGEINGL